MRLSCYAFYGTEGDVRSSLRWTALERVFKLGVLVVKHDPHASRHSADELEDVGNLHAIMICRSLAPRVCSSAMFNCYLTLSSFRKTNKSNSPLSPPVIVNFLRFCCPSDESRF